MLLHLAHRAFFHAEGERGSAESCGGVGNLLDGFLRLRPARETGVRGELLHGFQRRRLAVAAERGHVFAARVRAKCGVVERRRLPVATIVLQERPVFAMVVVIGKEQIEDGARDLSDADIERIAATYHRWQQADNYHDEPAYSYAATTAEIARNDYVLTPGRYVGTAETEEDSEPFAEKMTRLTALLNEQFAQGAALEAQIKANLGEMGYE